MWDPGWTKAPAVETPVGLDQAVWQCWCDEASCSARQAWACAAGRTQSAPKTFGSSKFRCQWRHSHSLVPFFIDHFGSVLKTFPNSPSGACVFLWIRVSFYLNQNCCRLRIGLRSEEYQSPATLECMSV